jgi:hypothetical protein
VTRPQPDEYAAFYAGYVARVADGEPIRELSVQRERLRHVLLPLTESQADFRYAPGKWSVKELLGHLADTERIFAYRMLRIARADDTPLAGFEENDYVRASGVERRPFADVFDEWLAVRHATSALVRGLPEESWERRGTANGAAVSARALLFIILGHVEHHMSILAERYGLALI